MARPVIALLTDFGSRDHYVGAMRGVALSICPEATLVDITHDIAPQDVLGGALELAAAFTYFPPGTVFLAVVDPGVGSTRRGIAAEAGQYRFVAPDNGLLSLVLRDAVATRVVELTETRYARPTISRTFEGRDRFAPAAAWLASGLDLSALGPAVGTWQRVHVPEPTVAPDRVIGEILRIDRFGNLVTNIDRDMLERFAGGLSVDVAVENHVIAGIAGTYAEVAADALCALFGSTDRLEIAVNGGSAAERLRADRGAPVVVSRR